MDQVRLIQPDFSDGGVAEVFDAIRGTEAQTFRHNRGFLSSDIELPERWRTLTRLPQTTSGSSPKPLPNAVSPLCAAEVDCPRRTHNHRTYLIERFDMSMDEALDS